MGAALAEIGFYYPGHLWRSGDWIKTLLLFFDGIGLLVPEYKLEEPEQFSPELAGPLRDSGLLHYLVADEFIDKCTTQRMAAQLLPLVSSGAFDTLSKDGTAFHEISMSRMGSFGDTALYEHVYETLKARGLAKDSEDGVSIPLHPIVRYFILTVLAQVLREKGRQRGLDLLPTTDVPRVLDALNEFLDLPVHSSAGRVVAFDLQTVAVDLSAVPLDEVLSFRSENGDAFRRYARSVRRFAREISLLPQDARKDAFNDRQMELDDTASELKRRSRMAWKKPASFALGMSGAVWTFVAGADPVGALFAGGAAVIEALPESNERTAFSYLFRARDTFRW